MGRTFENQLTQAEINRGVWRYIVRKQYYLLLFWFIILIPCLRALGLGAWFAIAGALGGAFVWTAVLFMITRTKFSPAKTAVFELGETMLRITDSGGGEHRYPYDRIAALAGNGIVVLCLPQSRFAIVSCRCAGREETVLLSRLTT